MLDMQTVLSALKFTTVFVRARLSLSHRTVDIFL